MIALIIPAIAVSQTSPAPVNLGTSGSFVALAKTGISTTGATSIVGDIGVSPNNASSITGFGLVADASGEFSTSSLINGKVYAANYVAPTPAKMTTAVSDMQAAYTDAAGRAPNFTELYTGNLTGQTLTTGVYKWSTGVLVSAGGFTISGSSTDVWIFEIAQNLTVANGATITLSGGAKSSNIFWQVAGQASLGTTSSFRGIILCQTLINIQTGAAFDGRALSQTAVTLDGNSINNNSTLGLADLYLENGITMYPNPAQNNVTIKNSNSIKLDQLAIFDVYGRLIHSIDLRDMQQEKIIDVSNLSSGVYMLQIQGDGARTTKRLIKS
ncbi:MAG: DUF3494 domain-containing protein [Bacteroidetes bacterium]|nr:DUF3494 domain-containing protein [Bacteroidota bacterium]